MKVLVAIVLTVGVLLTPSASAAPDRPKAMAMAMDKAEAARAAHRGQGEIFAPLLPGHAAYGVGKCSEDDMSPRWMCEVYAVSRYTTCTANLFIWSERRNYVFEWHRLRCGPRPRR